MSLDFLYEQARALYDDGQLRAAEQLLVDYGLQSPSSAGYLLLGHILFELGKMPQALEAYQKAVKHTPTDPVCHFHLGRLLAVMWQLEEAILAYRQVLALNPQFSAAWQQLGQVLYQMGRETEAIEIFQIWLTYEHGNPTAEHLLAAWKGKYLPQASNAYLRTVFDRFADRFDQILGQLDYRGPQLIAAQVETWFKQRQMPLDILDAGCGTGLCGAVLRPFARWLEGVDLSEKMLLKAQNRGVYDALYQEEITTYLENRGGELDLIGLADTFIYMGDLYSFFQAAFKTLRKKGAVVATFEPELEDNASFVLSSTGRYRHSERYIRQIAKETGFEICAFEKAPLRYEGGYPEIGYVVLMTKSKNDSERDGLG